MKKVAIKLIRFYQQTISPDHGFLSRPGASKCRFFPSCSQYSLEKIEKEGLIKGTFKGALRILRCNPLFRGGVDLS